jgi:hypothetical protein
MPYLSIELLPLSFSESCRLIATAEKINNNVGLMGHGQPASFGLFPVKPCGSVCSHGSGFSALFCLCPIVRGVLSAHDQITPDEEKKFCYCTHLLASRYLWGGGRPAPNTPQPGASVITCLCAREVIMPTLTLDEQLIFDVAVALKQVKIPGFRRGVVEEGRFEIAKTIVEQLKANRWEFSKSRLQ